jgi:hypothetical protein
VRLFRCSVVATTFALLSVSVFGCGGSSVKLSQDAGYDAGYTPPVPDAGPGVGSLTVTISGLPSGVNAQVLVTGTEASSFFQLLTATTTLSNLPVGTYEVTASMARQAGTTVDTAFQATPMSSSVQVTANATATATVAYAVQMGSGMLWVPGPMAGKIYGFPASSLVASGPATAPVILNTMLADGGVLQGPESLTFDRQGNLWAEIAPDGTGGNGNYIVSWSAAQLAASGSPAPKVVLSPTSTTFSGYASQMAFDVSGNLWVVNNLGLARLSPSALLGTGAPAGQVWSTFNWGGVSTSFSSPQGLAFDAAGNLWVSVDRGAASSAIYGFNASGLSTTGALYAMQAITTPTSPVPTLNFTRPEGMAFDAAGNLWVTQCGSFIGLVSYSKSQLATGGSLGVSPAVQLTSSGCPTGIAFDNQGDLWFSSYVFGAGYTYGVSASALTTSGTLTPFQTLTTTGIDFGGISFSPSPAALPLAP